MWSRVAFLRRNRRRRLASDLRVAPNGNAVELNGVARRFGRRWVLRGADLTVQRGEAIALMGRNGSGKTTLLRVIATLLRPTRGSGSVLGFDLVKNAPDVRDSIGLLGHRVPPLTTRVVDDTVRFELTPHLGIHDDAEDEMGGRQWQISS